MKELRTKPVKDKNLNGFFAFNPALSDFYPKNPHWTCPYREPDTQVIYCCVNDQVIGIVRS